ncbi:MAG: GIY-YIG nuclease family protein [Ignavibacteriae bacterium]|nr:GIY-YIG nuclease family protein [Ignavibacteriota bacterium]
MNSGAYQLFILVNKNLKIKIGSLGICNIKAGQYVYTGSAMNNLSKRILRHRTKVKKIHWHIDYLLNSKQVEIIKVKKYPSTEKLECYYNQKIFKRKGAYVPIKGFGSSDCRECESHLVGMI